jgi:hypothetical protein
MTQLTLSQSNQPIDRDSDQKTLLILGGYGSAGVIIAEMLLKSSSTVKIILAGRSLSRAEAAASKLNSIFASNRCLATEMDSSKTLDFNSESTIDLVVVASPSLGSTVKNVAESCIKAKVDYMDIQLSTEKLVILRSMKDEIQDAGLCFITDCGFHPGVPAALVRYAAGHLTGQVTEATIGSLISMDWGEHVTCSDTQEEFVSELLHFDSRAYRLGQWESVSWTKPKWINFDEFGDRPCIAMNLEEMHDLPTAYPDLQELGFYMAGFNTFVDWILMPFVILVMFVSPFRRPSRRAMGSLLYWGLKISSRPPYGTILKAEVKGANAANDSVTVKVKIFHKDAYWLTAAPTVACILQYMDGSIKKPGLWLQGSCVEPNRFLRDMETLGMECKTEIVPAPVSE